MTAPPAQTLVVFGASGDLARRKIFPALYNLAREGLLPERYAVVGYAPNEWDESVFREQVRQSVEMFSRSSLVPEVWGGFAGSLSYVRGTFATPGGLGSLNEHLTQLDGLHGTDGRRIYFCAVPASVFPGLVARLGESGGQERPPSGGPGRGLAVRRGDGA